MVTYLNAIKRAVPSSWTQKEPQCRLGRPEGSLFGRGPQVGHATRRYALLYYLIAYHYALMGLVSSTTATFPAFWCLTFQRNWTELPQGTRRILRSNHSWRCCPRKPSVGAKLLRQAWPSRTSRVQTGWSSPRFGHECSTETFSTEHLHLQPGPTPNTVRAADGAVLTVPEGWTLLPPGDAGLTRRVKAAGDHWVVQEKVGRKMFSEACGRRRRPSTGSGPNSTPSVHRGIRQEEGGRRPAPGEAQTEYVEDFHGAVVAFLAFHPEPRRPRRPAGPCRHRARHAGRQRHGRPDEAHPVEQRAEAAVIAWMRHRTTGYDEHGDPQGQGQAARGPPDARPAVPGVVAAVSSG